MASEKAAPPITTGVNGMRENAMKPSELAAPPIVETAAYLPFRLSMEKSDGAVNVVMSRLLCIESHGLVNKLLDHDTGSPNPAPKNPRLKLVTEPFFFVSKLYGHYSGAEF